LKAVGRGIEEPFGDRCARRKAASPSYPDLQGPGKLKAQVSAPIRAIST